MRQTQTGADAIEQHTFKFAQAIRDFGKLLPRTVSNVEDLKMLIRSSGNVGALYINARGSTSKAEYQQRILNCHTETQTTAYWLRLVDTQASGELDVRRKKLLKVSEELLQAFQQLLQK